MAKMYYAKDCDINYLNGKKIAIIGYGSQGHAHALNLKDSGCDVCVGLRAGSKNWSVAEKDGLKVMTVPEAAKWGDIVMMLINDEVQADVYKRDIAPNLEDGNALAFAHGFNIRYQQIVPPAGVDVFMAAPKGPGHTVRSTYVNGKGVPCLVAVEQNATGNAYKLALAYIAGYGGKVYIIVQDITQLNAVYGKDNALMANCHVRIAYAPNTIETAKTLSDMTGKTTVVEEKVSLSGSRTGHMKNASVNVTETARPLLTPDECMRLPGPEKDSQGRVLKPGDMLIFTAGQSPIYGRQILYFFDPVFSARAKIPVPGLNAAYPSGISDSLYQPRPASWYTAKPSSSVAPKTADAASTPTQENSSERYFLE